MMRELLRTHKAAAPAVSRRSALKRGGALAGAAVLLGGSQLRAAAGETALRLDVPMDGNTWIINRGPGSAPDAPVQRGDSFVVSGRIFPGGSFESGLKSAHEEGGIGTWTCRGWFYFDLEEIAEGAVPHVVTTQLYLFDDHNGLVSEGMEGGIRVVRAVTGGYGRYAGVRGEVIETPVGFNDTFLNLGGGVLQPAFNVSFEFRILT